MQQQLVFNGGATLIGRSWGGDPGRWLMESGVLPYSTHRATPTLSNWAATLLSPKIYHVSGMIRSQQKSEAETQANTGIDEEAQCHQDDGDRRFLLTILAVNCSVAKVSRRR